MQTNYSFSSTVIISTLLVSKNIAAPKILKASNAFSPVKQRKEYGVPILPIYPLKLYKISL